MNSPRKAQLELLMILEDVVLRWKQKGNSIELDNLFIYLHNLQTELYTMKNKYYYYEPKN